MKKDSLTERPQDRSRVRAKERSCLHEYAWIETVRSSRESTVNEYLVEYELLDRFYCKHCLDIKEISKKMTTERETPMPGWF